MRNSLRDACHRSMQSVLFLLEVAGSGGAVGDAAGAAGSDALAGRDAGVGPGSRVIAGGQGCQGRREELEWRGAQVIGRDGVAAVATPILA